VTLKRLATDLRIFCLIFFFFLAIIILALNTLLTAYPSALFYHLVGKDQLIPF
jgi:hypothetical protein